MRVLIVCDYSLLYLGGAQTALIRQAEALAQGLHDVCLLAPDAASVSMDHRISIVEPPRGPVLPGLDFPLLRVGGAIRRFIDAVIALGRFDLVLLHSEFALAATASAVAAERRVPVLHTVHTFFWRGPAAGAPLAPVVRAFHRSVTGLPNPGTRLAARALDSALREMTLAVARTADAVISPSAHQAVKLRQAGLEHVEVISNVTESSTALRTMPGFEHLRLAWLGRFSPEKRLDEALLGVTIAADRNVDLHLEVAGGKPNRRRARASRRAPVRWHGRLGPAEITRLTDDCHAVLLTSHGFDNQPMVALEAFSRGRPVIVVDPALAREFGGAAILCRSPEPAGIADTLKLLVREPWRIEFAAMDARARAQDSSSATHVTAIAELKEKLTAANAVARG